MEGRHALVLDVERDGDGQAGAGAGAMLESKTGNGRAELS
jgi:hypothetical protein